MNGKRWLTLVVAFVGVLVLGLVVAAVSWRLGQMGYEPFAEFWKRREPTPTFEILPVSEDEPACVLTDWHTVARFLELSTSVDVVTMGERNGTAFAALCLEETATDDEIYLIGQLALHALLVFGDEGNEYLVISFLLEPVGDDPRYRLQYGYVCQVSEGEIAGCDGTSLLGGYLSPESVQWPGREQ